MRCYLSIPHQKAFVSQPAIQTKLSDMNIHIIDYVTNFTVTAKSGVPFLSPPIGMNIEMLTLEVLAVAKNKTNISKSIQYPA